MFFDLYLYHMNANRGLNGTFKRNLYATDRQTDRQRHGTDCLTPLRMRTTGQ